MERFPSKKILATAIYLYDNFVDENRLFCIIWIKWLHMGGKNFEEVWNIANIRYLSVKLLYFRYLNGTLMNRLRFWKKRLLFDNLKSFKMTIKENFAFWNIICKQSSLCYYLWNILNFLNKWYTINIFSIIASEFSALEFFFPSIMEK